MADRWDRPVMQHDTSTVVESAVDLGSDRYRACLDQRFADRVLSRRQCLAAPGVHADAWVDGGRFEILFPTDRPLVSRATYLPCGGDQHLCRIGIGTGAQSVVDIVHRLCRRRHGLVRSNRLLHHGECAVLAWRRAQAQSQAHAVGEMCAMRSGGSMRESSEATAGLIIAYFALALLSVGRTIKIVRPAFKGGYRGRRLAGERRRHQHLQHT